MRWIIIQKHDNRKKRFLIFYNIEFRSKRKRIMWKYNYYIDKRSGGSVHQTSVIESIDEISLCGKVEWKCFKEGESRQHHEVLYQRIVSCRAGPRWASNRMEIYFSLNLLFRLRLIESCQVVICNVSLLVFDLSGMKYFFVI